MFDFFDGAAGQRRRMWVGVSLLTVFSVAALHFSGTNVVPHVEAQEPKGHGPLMSMVAGEVAEIRAGDVHRQELILEAGEFLRFTVEQQGVDLVLGLMSHEGQELLRVDTPNGAHGPEELLEIVEESGRFIVEVRAGTTSGRYRLVALEHRPASARDLLLVAADHEFHRLRRAPKDNPGRVVPPLKRLVEIWQRLELPAREAATLGEICRAQRRTSDLPGAAATCDRAVALYELLGDERALAVTLQNSGLVELQRGDSLRATVLFERAAELFIKFDNQRGLAVVLDKLGLACQRLGRMERALGLFQEALQKSQELRLPQSEAMVRTDLASVLLELRRPQEALENYERARSLFQALGSHRESFQALSGIARAALQLQDLDRAEKAALQATALAPNNGGPRLEDHYGRALAFNTLAHVHRARGETTKAHRALASALDLARQNEDQRTEAFVLLGIGSLEAAAGRFPRALDAYREALDWFEEFKDRRGTAIGQARMAESLKALDRAEEAWELISKSLLNVEALRHETPKRDQRLAYFAFRQDYYGIAFDILWRLHSEQPDHGWHSKALALDDRRRALELTDHLRHIQPQGDSRVQDWEQWLDEESLVLIYALGDEQSFLWSFSRGELEFHAIPGREQLEADARQFIDHTGSVWTPSENPRFRSAERLSQHLLGPVAEALQRHRRLILITDGELQALPFAALSSPTSEGRFLIETHELTTLPSLSAGSFLRSKASKKSRGHIALFADPVFRLEDPRARETPSEKAAGQETESTVYLRRAASLLDVNPWARLMGSRFEAENISQLWGGERSQLFIDFAASRSNFLALDFEEVEILHFATHALLHPEPDLSGLVLSLVDEEGRARDGFLRSVDISGLKLSVDLVILSACETGLGKKIRGEGTVGLAWSFLAAGAPRVITSLWEVRDQPTSKLMVSLYGHMHHGLSPAAALRQSQLEMLSEPGSRPHDWAAFVFQGDWTRPAWGDASTSSAKPQPRR